MLERQGQRLLQLGIVLMLYASLEGFVIPALRSPRIALSVHTLAALQGVFLLTQGIIWPRLRLTSTTARIAFWCSIYSTLAILGAYTISAISGVGIETIRLMGELPHGLSRGTGLEELSIKVLAYSSAPTGLVAFALILFGLRLGPQSSGDAHRRAS